MIVLSVIQCAYLKLIIIAGYRMYFSLLSVSQLADRTNDLIAKMHNCDRIYTQLLCFLFTLLVFLN